MNFLSGLHGAVALALLPALLFAEEAGVPAALRSGELVLLVAGLLIASGGLNPYAFIPLALVACIAGSLVGYSWARAVGDRALRGLAQRLRQQRNLERVEERLRAAGWQRIAISRLIPGPAHLHHVGRRGLSGAPRRSFILAMVTSTFVWVGVYVALGILIGVPVEHFLDQIQKLAVQGAILIVMGVGCYLAVRKTPSSSGAGLVRVPRWVRVVLAALLDIGVVASIVTGLLALGRLLGIGFGSGWVDAVVVAPGGRGVLRDRRQAQCGATAGEVLLQTSYVSGHGLPLKPRAALDAVRSLVSRSDDELTATGDLLHALGDPDRLRIVTQLLDRPQTLDELAARTKLSPFEVRHQLDRFQSTGVLVVNGQEPDATYAIRADLRHVLRQLLAIMESTPTATAPRGGRAGNRRPDPTPTARIPARHRSPVASRTVALTERSDDQRTHGRHCGSRRDGEHPGDQNVPRDTPSHRPEPAGRPRSHHGPRDHVCRAHRQRELRGALNHHRRHGLGAEAVDRLEPDHLHAQRPDDPPAARVCPEADRRRRQQHHPERR